MLHVNQTIHRLWLVIFTRSSYPSRPSQGKGHDGYYLSPKNDPQ